MEQMTTIKSNISKSLDWKNVKLLLIKTSPSVQAAFLDSDRQSVRKATHCFFTMY